MRRLLCVTCGDNYKLHPIDEGLGFKLRKIGGSTREPNFGMLPPGSSLSLVDYRLNCDLCGRELKAGKPALAITVWREAEPALWEGDYLGQMPVDSVVNAMLEQQPTPIPPELRVLADFNNEVVLVFGIPAHVLLLIAGRREDSESDNDPDELPPTKTP